MGLGTGNDTKSARSSAPCSRRRAFEGARRTTGFVIEEDDRKELQADFIYLRKWRKRVEQSQSLASAIVGGTVGASSVRRFGSSRCETGTGSSFRAKYSGAKTSSHSGGTATV